MRGRPPIPTAVQEAKGAYRKNPQRRRTNEPTAPAGRPEMPKNLKPHAKKAWTQTVQALETMGILSSADWASLEIYAEAYQQFKECQASIAQKGTAIWSTNKNGFECAMKNPDVAVMAEAVKTLFKVWSEFGLTPSARTRVAVTGEKKQDPLDELFAARGERN